MFERRRSPHRIISTILVALALLSTLFATLLVVNAYQSNLHAKQLIRVSTMVDHLNAAAVTFTLEQGLTSAALGRPGTMDNTARRRILTLRAAGDRSLQQALDIAGRLATLFRQGSGYHSVLGELRFAHDDLNSRRRQVDDLLNGGRADLGLDAWLATTTRLINNLRLVERIAVTTLDLPTEVGWVMVDLGGSAWNAARHLGHERSLLAYYVAARRIVPQGSRTQLISDHSAVSNNLVTILSVASHTYLTPQLRERIALMKRTLDEDYDPLRRQVLLAAQHGDYPVDGAGWLRSATGAVDTLTAIGDAVSQTMHARIDAIALANQQRLLTMLVLFAVSVVVTLFGLYKTRAAAQLLARQEQLADVTLSIVGDAVITTDTGQIVRYLNPVAEALTGWQADHAIGRPLTEIYRSHDRFAGGERIDPVTRCIAENRPVTLGRDALLTRRDGEEIVVQDSATPMRDPDGQLRGAVLVFYDATSLRHAPHLLTYHAHHDPLTGLLNRREFERRLDELVAGARDLGTHHVLCFLDLDNFKPINDTCGHDAGDRLLQQISYLLSQRVRGNDTLARIGGDEFAVLLEGCDIDKGLQVAQTLCDLIRDFRFVCQEQPFEIGASIGVAPITSDVVNAAQIMAQADAACYAAKEMGRNGVQLFAPENLGQSDRRGEQQWLPRLQQALDEDRFALYAQPIVPTTPGRQTMCEILVRLRDEDDNVLHPGSFLPAAERHRLTPELDRWVVRHTLRRLSALPSTLTGNHIFTVNLSSASLSDEGLFDFITAQLSEFAIDPAGLCFEITETTAAAALRQVSQLIQGLHELGCSVALDDFGTGLSSLAHLKHLNVDYLKIAAPFVRDVARDDIAAAMVDAIDTVAHLMGVKTIAEYVTTPDAIQRLRTSGVDFLQGYAVAQPLPLAEAIEWLQRRETGAVHDHVPG